MDMLTMMRNERDQLAKKLSAIDQCLQLLAPEVRKERSYRHTAATRRRISIAAKKRWAENGKQKK